MLREDTEIAVRNKQEAVKCMPVLSQYKYSLLQGSQASRHQLGTSPMCHGLKYLFLCEKERRWLLATVFVGRARAGSLLSAGVHSGSSAAVPKPQPDSPATPTLSIAGFL